MPLDLSKLQNVKRAQNGAVTAACPQCRAEGQDHTGDHLVIYPDGRFGCLTCPGAEGEDHRKRIWALAGDGSPDGAASGYVCQNVTPQIEIERTWPASCLDRLIPDYTYWAGRGISEATLKPFKGGVAADGQMKNRFVFPVFNSHGDIIGFDGRRIDGKPEMKWKIIGPSRKFLWGGLEEVEETGRAILVESIGDSLILREHGVPETICLFGTVMSQAVLAHLIAVNPSLIVVATNRDEKHTVGQDAAERIAKVLRTFFDEDRVKLALPPAKDFGESTAEQIVEWRAALESTESLQKET
jgi:hypothetical protein